MKHIISFSLLISILLFSCEKEPLGKDYVFIRYKGADMPVWVKGNLESKIFVIYIHGGPGYSCFIDLQNNFFSGIEDKYAMVYYDQRASGNSMGQSSSGLLTLEQFVEDLEVIVEYINTYYSPAHIVLLGHSWGGMLGTAYLLKEDNQSKISGWIEVDGAHNLGQNAYEYSRDYVLNYADSIISNGTNKEQKEWKEIKNLYSDKESWRDTEFLLEHSKNLAKAHGYFYDSKHGKNLAGVNQIFFSETDYLALLGQNKRVTLVMDVWYYDFTKRLGEIKIPTLLLWGKYDGILPLQLAYEAKESMNLSDENLFVFQKTAHYPHYEETDLFNQKVISFIEKNIE